MGRPMKFPGWLSGVGANLRQNHLWQRIVKHTTAVTIALIIVFIPAVSARYGPTTFLAPMTTVFGHAGQRFGQMAESLVLVLSGLVLGLGWSLLGLYLSSLIFDTNQPAAYTIRAIFVVIAVVFHGYFRSHSPRLFLLLFVILIVCFSILMGTAHRVTLQVATQILYPMLTAMGVLLVTNVVIFPEFSGSFLGETTIEALSQTETTLKAAVEWFIEPVKGKEVSEPSASLHSEASGTVCAASTSAITGSQSNQLPPMESNKSPKTATRVSRLASLTAAKGRLRVKLAHCTKAYQECTFEIMYSVLPPRSLKPISTKAMAALVQNVITLISACESKFALTREEDMEDPLPGPGHPKASSDSSGSESDDSSESSSDDSDKEPTGRSSKRNKKYMRARRALAETLKELKPDREIASGDVDVLESLLSRVREPVGDLVTQVNHAISLVMTCLAYCYDVARLPDGSVVPKGISLEEIDIRVDIFTTAIAHFDKCSTEALGKAVSVGAADGEVDIMPRIETFVMSSYLLSLRQAGEQTMDMLKHARVLVERRQDKKERRRVYMPRKINWKKWLSSGGEQDVMALPEDARKDLRTGKQWKKGMADDDDDDGDDMHSTPSRRGDLETAASASEKVSRQQKQQQHQQPHQQPPRPPKLKKKRTSEPSFVSRHRGHLADLIESAMQSEHLPYALKLAVAVMLVSWVAFYWPWNSWYSSSRATWAPLQLVLVFEVAIGSSFWVFMVRAGGVLFGCLSGFLAYKISHGNLIALVVILVIPIIPSAYVQLGTPYVKAGMISIVSMSVVSLSIVSHLAPAWEVFLRRLAAFMAGGLIAIVVEVALYPVRARDRLVESLSSCINQIGQMEGGVAAGVEKPSKVSELRSAAGIYRFNKARDKAQNSLKAAETFLPFCLSEPRLRGSFKTLEPIYSEIIYVLHQIIDRMDNAMALRQAYGTSVLTDLNPQIYSYRRNLAASITLTLFAVNEALTTRLPLPQFLPSCRLAQFRLVERVREVLQSEPSIANAGITTPGGRTGGNTLNSRPPTRSRANSQVIRSASQLTFLSWNAITAGRMEIIEYLEELVDLTKLLVGVNAFRSGMLDRTTYQSYVQHLGMRQRSASNPSAFDHRAATEEAISLAGEASGAMPMSPVSSAPADLRRRRMPSMGASTGLDRSLSVFRDGAARRRKRSNTGAWASQGTAEVDELPVSLQRVGTRLRQERSRARGMSVSHT